MQSTRGKSPPRGISPRRGLSPVRPASSTSPTRVVLDALDIDDRPKFDPEYPDYELEYDPSGEYVYYKPNPALASVPDVDPPKGFRRGLRRRASSRRDADVREINVDADSDEEEEVPEPVKNPFETKGTEGNEINLITNYYQVLQDAEWSLYKYRVDIIPEEDDKFKRKALIRANRQAIGPYLFDGTMLFTGKHIPGADARKVIRLSYTKKDDSEVTIELKDLGKTELGDPIYNQFYNVMVRKCLFGMGLEEMGRGFFDQHMAIDFPHLKIELWPGYITSMNHHDPNLLLCVEVSHKVVRSDNALAVIEGIKTRARGNFQQLVAEEFTDSIVMTVYNRHTYRVLSVDFNSTPMSTFNNNKNEAVSFINYYEKKGHQIKSRNQPLLVAKPTRRVGRKIDGKDEEDETVKLIPELCKFTGLTESMRSNFTIMKELAKHLHMSPMDRIKACDDFMSRLQGSKNLIEELAEWGIIFQAGLVTCQGRTLRPENIVFEGGSVRANDKADWTNAFRNQKLLSPKNLNNWIALSTQRDAEGIDALVKTMQKVATPLGFQITKPNKIMTVSDMKPQTFAKIIDGFFTKENAAVAAECQMFFIVLPNASTDLYAVIKKRLVVDYGMSSQCFLSKNMKSKGLMSIATKMVVQMCTKLGGEPWTIKLPLQNLIVIGFDSYKKGNADIGAMVASLNSTFTKYFSTVSSSSSRKEQSRNIANDLEKCLECYLKENGTLPERIVMYRMGDITADPLSQDTEELQKIRVTLTSVYNERSESNPKFTYIIVSKKINTRLMADLGRQGYANPPPGTILDHTLTLAERYDFFLVAATARQGTVSPCSYTVVSDNSGLSADKLQILTYKLCHLYFNWSGTVAVPACCQYARKLATLTAMAYDAPAHANLSKLLYYL